jgi:hypothetical protein
MRNGKVSERLEVAMSHPVDLDPASPPQRDPAADARDDVPSGPPFRKPRWAKAYAFALVTGALFLFSWLGQFVFQLQVARADSDQHGQPFKWSEFCSQFLASTFENWQSEFLQLVWQAAGLALFYYWGSSQSRESDERIEAKLDALLRDRNLTVEPR